MHTMLAAELAKARSEELREDARSTQPHERHHEVGKVQGRLGSPFGRALAGYWSRGHARHEQPLRRPDWRAG
jgi:hypothetical protein